MYFLSRIVMKCRDLANILLEVFMWGSWLNSQIELSFSRKNRCRLSIVGGGSITPEEIMQFTWKYPVTLYINRAWLYWIIGKNPFSPSDHHLNSFIKIKKRSKKFTFIELLFEFELNIKYQFSLQFSVNRGVSGRGGP